MKGKNKESYAKRVAYEIRENKPSFAVFSAMNIVIILILIRQFFQGNYESMYICFLAMALLFIPAMMQVSFKMQIPATLEVIIFVFIFAAEILGELASFYIKISWWDTALHTANGFLAAAIGCSLIVLLNHNENLPFQLSPLFVAIVAFCFSMTIGVLWEFFEFGLDFFLGFDTQKDTIIYQINSVALDATQTNVVVSIDDIKSVLINGEDLGLGGYLDIGLFDTMEDLFVNFIGAIVFSIIGYFYSKNHGKGNIIKKFMLQNRK